MSEQSFGADLSEIKGKETVKEIPLGTDSLGNPVKRGASVLSTKEEGSFSLLKARYVSDLPENIPCFSVDPRDPEEFFEQHVEITLTPGETWVPIDSLLAKGPEYWERVDKLLAYLSRDNEDVEPVTDISLEECLPFTAFGPRGGYISAIEVDPEKLKLKSVVLEDGTSSFHEIDTKIGSSDWHMWGTTLLATLVMTPSRERMVAFSTLKLKGDVSTGFKPAERVSLESETDVLDRLRYDFPWVQKEDMSNLFTHNFEYPTNYKELNGLDLKRYQGIDPGFKDKPLERELRPLERRYMGIRNYLRLAEIASWYSRVDAVEDLGSFDIQSYMGSISPEKRYSDALLFLSDVERETTMLSDRVASRERLLFGETLVDNSRVFHDRFLSRDTLELTYVGVYQTGLTGLSTNINYINIIIRDLPREDRKRRALRLVSEVVNHENGHLGHKDRRKETGTLASYKPKPSEEWPYEEIWTEWRQVVYPAQLKGEIPGDFVYQSPATEDKKGGAFEISAMFADLQKITKGKKTFFDYKGEQYFLEPDDVERSLLATAASRTERGFALVKGKRVLGFADLYDALAKTNNLPSYNERLVGCTDADYRPKIYDFDKESRKVDPEIEEAFLETVTNKVRAKVRQLN